MLRPPPDSILQDLEAWQDGEAELPIEEFYLSVQKHLARISEAERTLYSLSIPFHEDTHILPAQCRKAVASLHEMRILAQEFGASLNPSLGLLSFFTTPGCHLLFTLQVVEEQSANLIALINSYRTNCMNPSSQYALLQRKHISSTFKRFLSYVKDILLQAKPPSDETRSSCGPQLRLVPVEEALIEFTDLNPRQSWQGLLQKQEDDISSLVGVDTSDRKGRAPRILHLEDYRNRDGKAAKQAAEHL